MTRTSLDYATVLVELGWLHDAELEVADALDEHPEDLGALGLLAKIKHLRGELSSAIACWAQLHARATHDENALMQLRSLLQLAEDPERGAGEFLALGQYQLARKPAGQLALEDAFRLLHARQPNEARARCAATATRYRTEDPQLYKLAVLANAWIAELSGDIESARETLELLGRERGFETDEDRLLGLVRIYERIGTRERLESAVKICRHLERQLEQTGAEKVSLLSRLAVLYRRLGEQDLARTYALRHLHAFRRRMYRPSFRSTIAVAARRYVSLRYLLSIRFACHELEEPIAARERALASALLGERAAARAAFADGSDVLDRKYLADVLALEGDALGAEELFLATLAADPDDLQVVGWLLGHRPRQPSAAVVARFSDPELYYRTRDNLQAAILRAPLRPSLWGELAELHRIRGERQEATRCDERAAALAEAAERRSRPIGRVLSAGVYAFLGKAKGLIHEVWADREPVDPGQGGSLPPDHVLGNLTAELKESVRNIFLAVREYARTKFPHQTADLANYSYTFKVPKEDERSGGLSAGVPSALAFLSVFLQRPVPQTMAFSGMLVADAHDVLTVRRVGDADLKVAAAYHRNLEAIVLPRANATDLELSPRIPPAISEEVVRYATSFDEIVKLVWGTDVFARA